MERELTTGIVSTKPEANEKFEMLIESFYGQWIWRAVHALIDHQDFRSSPKWMAEKLGVGEVDINEALDGLRDLSLIETVNGEIVSKNVQFLIPDSQNHKSKRLINHQTLAASLLGHMTVDSSKAFGRSLFVASSEELMSEFNEKVKELIEEYDRKSEKCEKDGLYAITVNGVELTSTAQQKGVQ